MMRFIPDSPHFAAAYDDTVRPPVSVSGELARYDRTVFLRWNRMLTRWECWRIKGSFLGSSMDGLIPEEIAKRAAFWFAICTDSGEALPLDNRLMVNVWAVDWWRRAGLTAQQLNAQMVEEERARLAKLHQADQQHLMDFCLDHKRQLYALRSAHSIHHIMHPTRGKDPTKAFST